jgi:hypothetical protein
LNPGLRQARLMPSFRPPHNAPDPRVNSFDLPQESLYLEGRETDYGDKRLME